MLKLQQKVNFIYLLHDGDRGRCEDLFHQEKSYFISGNKIFGRIMNLLYTYTGKYLSLFLLIYIKNSK